MCAEPKGQPEPTNRNPENLPTPVKVVAATKTATKGALYMVLASATLACGYFIVRELMPSCVRRRPPFRPLHNFRSPLRPRRRGPGHRRMSPNSLFNEAFDRVQSHPDVTARIGSPVKGYGKDHGGRRAGRRNFVENQTYTDKEGIQRMRCAARARAPRAPRRSLGRRACRIRFNVEGPRGKGIVYTEIAESMGKGDFYYLVFQDKKTGEAIGIIDNRPVITRQQRQKQVVEALEEGGVGLLLPPPFHVPRRALNGAGCPRAPARRRAVRDRTG